MDTDRGPVRLDVLLPAAFTGTDLAERREPRQERQQEPQQEEEPR